MLNSIISSNTSEMSITTAQLLIVIISSLALGLIIAKIHMFRNSYTKNFIFTVALLPVLVSSVIMVVNGNLGAGITVAGAFSLVRFRSAPGNAREISTIFFAMATGLAIGMGYILYAFLFTVLVSFAMVLYTIMKFGDSVENVKEVRITVPETINYVKDFNHIFKEYAEFHRLNFIKTTNLGSLIEVSFTVHEKNPYNEKQFLDEIRTVNGNLPVLIKPAGSGKDEL